MEGWGFFWVSISIILFFDTQLGIYGVRAYWRCSYKFCFSVILEGGGEEGEEMKEVGKKQRFRFGLAIYDQHSDGVVVFIYLCGVRGINDKKCRIYQNLFFYNLLCFVPSLQFLFTF